MAVAVAIGLILLVRVTYKRANTGARMGAIVIVLLVLWLCVALVNASSAGIWAAGFASGFAQLIVGLGHFIGDIHFS